MQFDLSDDQEMMRETFARFLDEHSSIQRVRAALPTGFDRALWTGLAELGAFGIRVPEAAGGLGLGLIEATVLTEECGRTLASGPVVEALVAARLLAAAGEAGAEALAAALAGDKVVTIAMADIAEQPVQWVAGGHVADAVVARRGDALVLVDLAGAARPAEETLGDTPLGELKLAELPHAPLLAGAAATGAFAAALEEWKLLIGAQLSGLSREALTLAAAYASERKQFGQFIGTFQAISHPLADRLADVDGGKLLVLKAIRDIADGSPEAAATISLACWWACEAAATTVAQALHTFGGYGLTTEYDVYLFNLRAKALPLVLGDPRRLLEEAGRRLYAEETTTLPEAGEVPIDFDLGDEARAIREEIVRFISANATDEERARFHYSWEGFNPRLNRLLAKEGLLYPSWPKSIGGRGLSPYAKLAAMEGFEESGYNNPAPNVTAMVGYIVDKFGTPELKADVWDRIVNGEVICSLGYSEPGSGSDVFSAQCRATQEPDGSWRINGTKMFTSGANLADYVFMLTRTDPDAPKHKGLTMFLVPLKAEGVTIQPVYTFQEERTNITFYDNVHVPDSYRLGGINEGGRTMAAGLELEHGGGFSKSQWPMLRAAESLCREIRTGNRALIDEPQAQMRLARTTANVMVSDLFAFRSLWASTEKKPNAGFGPMAKMFSSEKFQSDARDLLDLTAPRSLAHRKGPAGVLNMAYRHAQGTTIYGGSSEVHRSMIAERALGLPRTRA